MKFTNIIAVAYDNSIVKICERQTYDTASPYFRTCDKWRVPVK